MEFTDEGADEIPDRKQMSSLDHGAETAGTLAIHEPFSNTVPRPATEVSCPDYKRVLDFCEPRLPTAQLVG